MTHRRIIFIIILTTLLLVAFKARATDKWEYIRSELNQRHLEAFSETYPTQNEVIEEIILQATYSGIPVKDALRIANCESKYGKYKHNLLPQHSSKGVYQFISKTWLNYCYGNVLNHKENISCFMQIYKKFPSWWECK